MPSPPAPDRIAGLTWSAVPSLIGFVIAGVFLSRASGITGPEATYPVVLAVVVLAIGVVNLVRDLTASSTSSSSSSSSSSSEEEDQGPTAVARTVAFIVVLLAALVLLEPAGFFPTTAVMVIGGLLCFGVRNPLVIAAATALVVGFGYLVFVRLLVVPFPPGFLGLT